MNIKIDAFKLDLINKTVQNLIELNKEGITIPYINFPNGGVDVDGRPVLINVDLSWVPGIADDKVFGEKTNNV